MEEAPGLTSLLLLLLSPWLRLLVSRWAGEVPKSRAHSSS